MRSEGIASARGMHAWVLLVFLANATLSDSSDQVLESCAP